MAAMMAASAMLFFFAYGQDSRPPVATAAVVTLDEVSGAIPSSHHRILEARITGSDILGGPAGVEGGIATLVAAWIAIALLAWWASTRTRVPPRANADDMDPSRH